MMSGDVDPSKELALLRINAEKLVDLVFYRKKVKENGAFISVTFDLEDWNKAREVADRLRELGVGPTPRSDERFYNPIRSVEINGITYLPAEEVDAARRA